MTNETFNGWTNKETWLTKLSLDQEDDWNCPELIHKQDTIENNANRIKEYINSGIDETVENGFVYDLLQLSVSVINWAEIAKHAMEEME